MIATFSCLRKIICRTCWYAEDKGRFSLRASSAIVVKIQEVSRIKPCAKELNVLRVAWGKLSSRSIIFISKTAVPYASESALWGFKCLMCNNAVKSLNLYDGSVGKAILASSTVSIARLVKGS